MKSAFIRALGAALFVVIHTSLALLIVGGIYAIQRSLFAAGDPKLFDILPLRYLFDSIDVCMLGTLLLSGDFEARVFFRAHYGGTHPNGGDGV